MNNEPTRKEKKQLFEYKRREFADKIMNVVFEYWRKHKTEKNFWTAGLIAGDDFLRQQIKERPQEKQFIISCGELAAKIINRSIELQLSKSQEK